jgi:hypothetical protein
MSDAPSRVTPQSKPFSYSYSRLKTFESCPKKYLHTLVLKDFVEPESEEMAWGQTVHKQMERAVITGTYPPDFPYAADAQRVLDILAAKPDAEVLVEQQLAVTRTMQKTTWFGKDAYLRVVVDLAVLNGPVGFAIDWKTGKRVEDSPQLLLTALAMFIHYPKLQAVRTEFGWLKTHERTGDTYYRDRIMPMIQAFQPRVTRMEQATVDGVFPASPSGLCRRWCPVKVCPHHGT